MGTIGSRMKKLRLSQELSLSEVSKMTGIPLSTYREWESGRQIIGEPYVKIARALNVSLYTLLTGEEPKVSQIIEKTKEIKKNCNDLLLYLDSIEFERKSDL